MSGGRPAEPTGPADAQPAAAEPTPAASPGPPGARIFSLEGRPAPGLYLIAWLLTGGGLASAFVGSLAGPPVAGILLMAALVLLALGLAAAAGYQIVARSRRGPDAYRGPAPVIVFAILFVVANAVGLAMLALGLADLTTVPGFLIGAGTLFLGYVVGVWLFVVRSGALSWTEMGVPRGLSRQVLADAGFGVAVMLPTTFIVLIVGGLVARFVGVQPPSVVPTPQGTFEVLAVALAAAVAIPIGEELFFRGFVLTAWLRDVGAGRAIVRSALFFTLVHIANITAGFDEGLRQALLQSVVILPLGLVLGWLFVQRGLVAPTVGHITYNGTVLLLATLAQRLVPAPAG